MAPLLLFVDVDHHYSKQYKKQYLKRSFYKVCCTKSSRYTFESFKMLFRNMGYFWWREIINLQSPLCYRQSTVQKVNYNCISFVCFNYMLNVLQGNLAIVLSFRFEESLPRLINCWAAFVEYNTYNEVKWT